jgi:hypothetical protein
VLQEHITGMIYAHLVTEGINPFDNEGAFRMNFRTTSAEDGLRLPDIGTTAQILRHDAAQAAALAATNVRGTKGAGRRS